MGRQAWRGHDTAVDCIENGEGRTHRPSRSSKHKWQDATPREQSRSSKHKGPRAELVRSTDDDDLEEELEMEARKTAVSQMARQMDNQSDVQVGNRMHQFITSSSSLVDRLSKKSLVTKPLSSKKAGGVTDTQPV